MGSRCFSSAVEREDRNEATSGQLPQAPMCKGSTSSQKTSLMGKVSSEPPPLHFGSEWGEVRSLSVMCDERVMTKPFGNFTPQICCWFLKGQGMLVYGNVLVQAL